MIGDRTRSVGFKLDKESQTTLSHDSSSKRTSMTSQTSTEDDDSTSPSSCRCFDYHHSENINTPLNVKCSGSSHLSKNLTYIDCNGDRSSALEQDKDFNEFQRGFRNFNPQ